MAQRVTAAAARRERGRQEMRATILDAARRIVVDEGIDALSMRAVARAIGYSPAALYEYFPAKEDVLAALYFEGAGGLNGRMRDTMATLPPDVSTAAALMALGRAYRAYAHQQPALYRLVLGGGHTVPPVESGSAEGKPPEQGFEVLVEVAARGVERGELLPLPPPVIAVACWAAVHGFVSLELAELLTGGDQPGHPPPSEEEGRARREAMFDAALQMCLFGLMKR